MKLSERLTTTDSLLMNSPQPVNEVQRPLLHHYSQNIVTKVKSRDVSERGRGHHKPAGFWVSIDELDDDGEAYGWAAWCESEGYSLGTVRHLVTLLDAERLLWITTADDLIWFDKTFGKQGKYDSRDIDWSLVADQFAGVVIAPYQWSQRFDLGWYYGWDCASGVIWDASIVDGLTVVARQQEPK